MLLKYAKVNCSYEFSHPSCHPSLVRVFKWLAGPINCLREVNSDRNTKGGIMALDNA